MDMAPPGGGRVPRGSCGDRRRKADVPVSGATGGERSLLRIVRLEEVEVRTVLRP